MKQISGAQTYLHSRQESVLNGLEYQISTDFLCKC